MEPTKEIKLQLLVNELALHENSKYILSVRHRVSKTVKSSPEVLKQIEDELAQHEMAIDEINKLIKELE